MTIELKKSNNGATNNRIARRTIAPPVDIQELADSFVVRLDIPGADKESIAVRVANATLTVTANAPEYFDGAARMLNDNLLPSEYRREFTLADNIDPDSIVAVYELGVLRITLKKKQQYLPKEIAIK